MEKKLSNRGFAKKFDEIAGKFDSISNPYTLARRCREALAHVKGRCLEVGAGTGNVASYMGDKKNYILSDISIGMCRVASKNQHASAVCCDAESLPFSPDSFDSIVSLEVVYYLNNPESFIKEARRVLREKGKLIIIMANDDMKIYDGMRKALRKLGISNMYFDDGITSFMKLKELQKLLAKNGFKTTLSKKIVMFPLKMLHNVNLIVEKTFLKNLCAFVFVVAEKTGK